MAKQKKTAKQSYQDTREDVARLQDWIDMELDRHQTRADAEPSNWGFVGDLGHIRLLYMQALTFLSGLEHKDIEEQLDECR